MVVVAINPFLVGYEKKEDKITALFLHVLEQCDCTSDFLAHIEWDSAHDFAGTQFTMHEVQLHTDFQRPVRRVFILGISNEGGASSKHLSGRVDGNPDGYIYDEVNEILVLVESKVGNGVVSEDQLMRHRSRVSPNVQSATAVISWRDVIRYFEKCGYRQDSLSRYIILNFIGVIYQDVLASEYNREYFLYLANRHRPLVTSIVQFIEDNYSGYYVQPVAGHTEVRWKTLNGNSRFVTFVLRNGAEPRFIMHPGGRKGLELRKEVYRRYGVQYYQGDEVNNYSSYPQELSIPLSSIDGQTLRLKPQLGFRDDGDAEGDIRYLIRHTVDLNPSLRGIVLQEPSK